METGRVHAGWLMLVGALLALWLFGCARTPAPPASSPAAIPAEPVATVDPQLAFATRLAEATLEQIARQHVLPGAADALHARFAERLTEQLAETPWREPRSTNKLATPADTVRRLHLDHLAQPILPAVEAVLAELVRGLGTDSVYFGRRQFELLQHSPEETAGIGVLMGRQDQQRVIREVIQGTPADRAGLKPGDELLAIDGEPVAGQSRDWIMLRLQGVPASTLALRIRFADGDSRHIRLQRELLDLPLVEGRWLRGGIAYVRLRTLSDSIVPAFNETFLGLIRKQRAPRALVLDLRHNRGGLLDSAVQLADLFVAEGTLLTLRGRVESELIRHVAQPRSEILERDLPLAVLIDGETAAGAESIAAALQDHRRALLVGQRSRGAGLLHTIIKLPGKRGLKLATGHLYRPTDEAIAPQGVVPDICLFDGQARLIARGDGSASGRECGREPGQQRPGTDPALDQVARILADKALYRDLLEGRVRQLPAP